MITHYCPHCGQRHNSRRMTVGNQIRCTSCGHRFTLHLPVEYQTAEVLGLALLIGFYTLGVVIPLVVCTGILIMTKSDTKGEPGTWVIRENKSAPSTRDPVNGAAHLDQPSRGEKLPPEGAKQPPAIARPTWKDPIVIDGVRVTIKSISYRTDEKGKVSIATRILVENINEGRIACRLGHETAYASMRDDFGNYLDGESEYKERRSDKLLPGESFEETWLFREPLPNATTFNWSYQFQGKGFLVNYKATFKKTDIARDMEP